MSAICVIGMRVRENCLLYGFPRVDVKIALTAIQPTVSKSYQASAFHVRIILQEFLPRVTRMSRIAIHSCLSARLIRHERSNAEKRVYSCHSCNSWQKLSLLFRPLKTDYRRPTVVFICGFLIWNLEFGIWNQQLTTHYRLQSQNPHGPCKIAVCF